MENVKVSYIKMQDGNFDTIEAPDTVLATGGLGGLFKHSTNFRHLTADSLAICLRHNVDTGEY